MKQNEEQKMDAMGAENPHKQASGRLPGENGVRAPSENNSARRIVRDTHNFGKTAANVEHPDPGAPIVGTPPSPTDSPMGEARLKTPAEAADYLRCSVRTLWKWKAKGVSRITEKGDG
jgi:hypothetical protein